MDLKPVRNWEKWRRVCAWCRRKIPDDVEVFSLHAKAAPRVDLACVAGTIIPICLATSGQTVPAMVAGLDSPAKKDGKDLLFMLCSETCGTQLQQVLGEEIDLGRQLRARFEPPPNPPDKP